MNVHGLIWNTKTRNTSTKNNSYVLGYEKLCSECTVITIWKQVKMDFWLNKRFKKIDIYFDENSLNLD